MLNRQIDIIKLLVADIFRLRVLKTRSSGYDVLLVVSLMSLALLVRLAIAPVNAGLQYITFFPAITLAAIAYGFRAGILATLIGVALATYLFTPPYNSFSTESWKHSFWPNLVFFMDGIVVSFAIEVMHRYRSSYQQELLEYQKTAVRVVTLNQELDERITELKHREQELQKFQAIIDSTDDAVISKTLDGIIQSWNRGAERIFGYTPAEIVGNSMSVLIPADHFNDEVEMLSRISRGEKVVHLETARLCKDGRLIYISSTMSPLFDIQGSVVGVSQIARDITERKAAENQLRASEKNLSVTLNSIGEAVIATDAGGCVTRMNNIAEKLTGHTQAEAVGHPVTAIFHALNQKTREPAANKVDAALAEGVIQNMSNDTALIAYQGDECPITYSCTPIRDGDEIIGTVLVFRDMSREFAARQALTDSVTRIQTIFNTVADGIITIDEHGMIESINPAAEHLFGQDAAEVAGQNVNMLMPEPYHSQHEGYLKHFCTTGDARIIGIGREVSGQRKDGSTFPMYLNVNEMWLDGRRHFTGIVYDITERKQTEQNLVAAKDVAERANHAKDAFLATMSHEIRTPLTGMLGMLEVLSLTQLNREQKETLKVAFDSSRSLLRIVNDILDWSKIEEGQMQLEPQATSLPQLLQDIVDTYSRSANAKSLVLWQHADARLSPAYIVDPFRLAQVLNNFVSNAIKFTQYGEIELRAELLAHLDNGERIRFSVKDTGIGIARDVQTRLFQRYQQGRGDTARMYGGTGLGLAISQRLAELMGGLIELESEPDQGATFSITLTLPVTAAPVESRVRNQHFEVDQSVIIPLFDGSVDAPLVLAVDDHPINSDLLARQLKLLGLRVETAVNGLDALSMWRSGRFALVITDCHMPVMDGYVFSQTIRKIEADEARPRTTIIAWTANALDEEVAFCHAAGMDELLVKPTSMTQLKKILLKWLFEAETDNSQHLLAQQNADNGQTSGPIDFAELAKVMPDLAEQIQVLHDFQSHIRTDLARLPEMLNLGDRVNLEHTAHRMKGSCRMVGAKDLANACAALEQAAKGGDMDRAGAAMTELNEAFTQLENYLSTQKIVNEKTGG